MTVVPRARMVNLYGPAEMTVYVTSWSPDGDAVVVLDALPLTASGKLDRRALTAPGYAAGAGAGLTEEMGGDPTVRAIGSYLDQ